MKTIRCLLLIPFCLISIGFNINGVTGYCPSKYQSRLLQLKSNLTFDSAKSKKLVLWSQTTSCCQWSGVTCSDGRVTGLDLSEESIFGGIDDSSSLFSLQYLQSLNLAFNDFNTVIPSGFHKLKNLRHLNLSHAGFVGQISIEISQLTSLVTLDLSTYTGWLELYNPNLAMLIHNLSEVTELYLDGVNISAQRNEWCHAISSSLPKLQVLSLSNCNLKGPIDSSLERLRSLSVILLSWNNFSAQVPEFFGNFQNLTILDLSLSGFRGRFPKKIFQLRRLVFLDISLNEDLYVSLPEFPQNGSLQTLILSSTKFYGQFPNSISNLGQLSRLDLSFCQFNGTISSTLSNLTELVYLDLSYNNFSGTIPALGLLKKLVYLDLSSNGLTDTIPSTHFEGLLNLVHIDLRNNSFRGRIPSSMFLLPSVREVLLSNNQFDGQLSDIIKSPSSELLELNLDNNNLEGAIPVSLFALRELNVLQLSSNKFSGNIELSMIQKLRNLSTLDLSNNNLSIIDTTTTESTFSSFPTLVELDLASCKLTTFPNFLRNQSRLFYLGLSNNYIGGSIPHWIWSSNSLRILNLSHNYLTEWEQYFDSNASKLFVIDVHSNYLPGLLPVLSQRASYVDYSDNNISYAFPPDIGSFLPEAFFLSFSKNNLHGSIPESICNASNLHVLDLSSNSLTGKIPKCLIAMNGSLAVLNLRRNKLIGRIDTYTGSCDLRTIDLNGNFLQGNIPSYLANCNKLEVLDLGNNQINDQFPCWLKSVSTLRVLILRSNRLYGSLKCPRTKVSWPHLQIFDIASNNFSGRIPPTFFENWKAMMADQNNKKLPQLSHIQFQGFYIVQVYYQDSVTITSKMMQMELVKILIIFTSIDFSCNKFEGPIPDELGQLTALYILNSSQNALTGQIPWSIGNLRLVESLDLSSNKLSGMIPAQLASLTFLSFLNLSYNQLVGRIPTSTQLQSLSESSYQGNAGLCGPPLTPNCSDNGGQDLSPPPFETRSSIDWNFLSAELGFTFGFGFVILPLIFWRRWRLWYCKHVDDFLYKVIPQLDFVYEQRGGKRYRTLRWRPY